MNFHKKIGFLAALLLMIGLGVPDSFAQNSIDVVLEIPGVVGVVEEAETAVGVTVTLSPEPDDGTIVAVKVVAVLLDGSQIGSTTITVVGGGSGEGASSTGTIDVTPPHDADADNETVQVTATAAGYASGSAVMKVTDNELTIVVTVTPDGTATGFREGTTVTADVQVRLVNSDGDEAPLRSGATPVTVSVSFAPAEFTKVLDASDVKVTLPLKIDVAATLSSNMLENYQFVVENNTVNVEEDIKVTATAKAKGYVDGTTELTIEDDEQTLTLAVDPTEVTEGSAIDNPIPVGVTVTLSPAPGASTPVTVTARINGIQIGVLDNLNLDASGGTAQGILNLLVDDDEDDSGMRTIVLTATFGEGEDRVKSSSVNVTLEDNDQAQTMTLSISATEVTEGGNGVVAVTVTFAYPPNFNAETPVTVTTKSDRITVGTGVTVSIPKNMVSANSDLTIPLPENDDVDSGDRTIVVTASTTIDDGDEETDDEISVSRNVTIKDNDTGPPPTGQLEISTNISNLRENAPGRDVEVTATLSEAPAEGTTVMVTVTAEVPDEETTVEVSGPITIVGPATTGTTTVNIDPSNDGEFTTRSIVLTGTVTGLGSDTATIGIIDDDTSVGTLAIAPDPPSLNKENKAQTVDVEVTATMADKSASSGSVTVTVSTDKGKIAPATFVILLADNPDKVPDTVAPAGNKTFKLTIPADDANAGGTITVTAMAASYVMGTSTIPIRDRVAGDVVGFRVVMTAPGAGAWTAVGNNKVTVQVRRVNGIAYPWTDFTSIEVSLRDTLTANASLTTLANALTAQGFNEVDGAITFEKDGTGGGITYVAAQDALQFKLQVPANKRKAEDGQYFGVYAQAAFTYGGTNDNILTNRQTEDPIYSDPAVLNSVVPNEAERYIGDGKLIKIDNQGPIIVGGTGADKYDPAGVSDIALTVDDDGAATVGDKIRVAVKVGTSGTLFRQSLVQIQLKTVTETVDNVKRKGQTAKTATFLGPRVIAATDDSLRVTWDVTEGLFTLKPDDFVEGIGQKDTPYQPDNWNAIVSVVVKDQAGNAATKSSDNFPVDSKSPSVSILYPSAAPDGAFDHTYNMRFTGAMISTVEGQTVDEHLNPLRITANEDLSKLEVFAVGADTLEIDVDRQDIFASGAVEDTITIATQGLSSPKKDKDDDYEDTEYVPSSANVAGTQIDLAVLATDQLGNVSKATISGVTHDDAAPKITDWFPKNRLIQDDQINEATRHPVFTLNEAVDSVAVNFTASNGDIVKEEVAGLTEKGESLVVVTDALEQDETYSMTIFVRDLAGNVFITSADSSASMAFNADFDNPKANMFVVTTETDSVIAGQANKLTIQSVDHDAASNTSRDALTYKSRDEDGTMAAEVRISAWDASGGAAESVWFEGKGVTDNGDGSATLDNSWLLGKRTVVAKSNKALDNVKVLVEHRNAGDGGTTVAKFDGAIEDLYVGAADFAGFDITAWEDGVEGATQEIWGDYTLRVVPVDRHGNPSVRAFKLDEDGKLDSLNVLDTRVKDNAFEYNNGIDVEIIGIPDIEDFGLLILSIEKEGVTYDLVTPDNRRSQTVQVRVVNMSLMEGDSRSQNVRSTEKFTISAPLTPVLTLWVPGSDVDEAGNDVVIPADPGDVTVTVAAQGYNAGDMVTFTRNGTAMDPRAADDDGVARLDITASLAGTTTVSASNGVYSTDELSIVFTETPAEPTSKSYATADGDPVYLIYRGDAPPDMTVGVDDFLALVAAFGSSDGDANYNAQADSRMMATVDVDDFLVFVGSFGQDGCCFCDEAYRVASRYKREC